jgi:hypothetical protein
MEGEEENTEVAAASEEKCTCLVADWLRVITWHDSRNTRIVYFLLHSNHVGARGRCRCTPQCLGVLDDGVGPLLDNGREEGVVEPVHAVVGLAGQRTVVPCRECWRGMLRHHRLFGCGGQSSDPLGPC